MPSTTFWKPSKLLADGHFGSIPLHRFVASARWRAVAGVCRWVKSSSVSYQPVPAPITFASVFGLPERLTPRFNASPGMDQRP